MTRRIVGRLQLVPAISSKLGGGRSGRDGIVVDLEQHQLDLEQHMEDPLEKH